MQHVAICFAVECACINEHKGLKGLQFAVDVVGGVSALKMPPPKRQKNMVNWEGSIIKWHQCCFKVAMKIK